MMLDFSYDIATFHRAQMAATFGDTFDYGAKLPDVLTLDAAVAFVSPSADLKSLTRGVLSFMLRGIVRSEVLTAALSLHRALHHQGQVNLCKLAFDPRIDCGVDMRGALLRASWRSGMLSLPKSISGFEGFQHGDIMGWLDRTEPNSRMRAAELATYTALPDEFTVYRGAAGSTLEGAASSFSWSRDIEVANWYAQCADAVAPARNMLLAAEVSKSAVISCHWWDRLPGMTSPLHRPGDELTEPEVIIDYRQVRNLREVEELQYVV